MDHETDISGDLDPDDFEEVAGVIRPDCKNLGRIVVGFEVDHSDDVVESVTNGCDANPVFVRRLVNLHTRNIVIRNPTGWNGVDD